MAVQLTDGTNNNLVDATSKGILVQPSKVAAQAGFVGLAAIRDAGTVTGSPTVEPMDSTVDGRLRVGIDTQIFNDEFAGAAQNTANWSFAATTFTNTYANGFSVLNGGAVTTASAYGVLKTYRSFPFYRSGALHCEFRVVLSVAPQANNAVYMGLGIPGTTAAPTDGVYFQYDTGGVFRGVVNNNGTITQSSPLTAPSAGVIHEYEVLLSDDQCEFWIDGVLQATVQAPSSLSTAASSGAAPVFFQTYNAASAPSLAQQVKVGYVNVWLADEQAAKPFPHQQAGEGKHSAQGQTGGTMGSTALCTNNTAPTAAVPTNTTAALGTGLGGRFFETTTLALNTDGIISSYQNPVGSATQPPRTLYITGIRWQSAVQTAVTALAGVGFHSLCWGHTALSLATAEGAAAKAPRRIVLAAVGISAPAVGANLANIDHQFATPIVVNPGEYIATAVMYSGTVGTAGTIAHGIAFEGYWE